MFPKPQPPSDSDDDDNKARPPHLRGSDLAKFAGALIAAVGLGGLGNRLRKRSEKSDMENKPQRRVVSGQRRDPADLARGRPPKSDIEEEKIANAEDDAAIEAKRALGHEPFEIALRPVVITTVLIIVLCLVTFGGMYGLFTFFGSRSAGAPPPSALDIQQPTPPAPRLQTNATSDWQSVQATAEAKLSTYGWVNQAGGQAHIPIDQAIELLSQRGLPVAPGSTRQFNDHLPNLDSMGGQPPQTSAGTETQPTATAP